MPNHKIEYNPSLDPTAGTQQETGSQNQKYILNDTRNCRNCDQPIYFGGVHWWHRHNESSYCVKGNFDVMTTAEPDLDSVERVRAAGPELLEALKQAMLWIPRGWSLELDLAFTSARAAIAKAEGRNV